MLISDRHIKEIAQGSMSSFKLFFDAFYPALSNFCDEFVRAEDVASDIAQDAMIEFWRNRHSQASLKQAKVYLYSICRNKSLNHLRHQKVQQKYRNEPADDYELVDLAYIEEEVFNVLHIAVGQLPERSQHIIKLALRGYANSEIAQRLNISINTVKTLKKNAYSKLRVLLKDHVFALAILSAQLFG
ncbi:MULTISPECIES: sigma-70 family RNA polymerase sigma factor [unclassified Carboxylicivirga]|uniref:sigma-70 family RNA polymerase sigma factor n=1 Tax=Carboxylicivirga TaxID=1628153 RepID=UPI003D335422